MKAVTGVKKDDGRTESAVGVDDECSGLSLVDNAVLNCGVCRQILWPSDY